MQFKIRPLIAAAAAVGTLSACAIISACTNNNDDAFVDTPAVSTTDLRANVKNIVVIYAENRSFDNTFGNFPGANGLANAASAPKQKDRDGTTVLATLPQVWGGVLANGQVDGDGNPVQVLAADTTTLANAPLSIETGFNKKLNIRQTTRDLYHRFFENQMQIGPNNDNSMFAAWADSGGMVMGHYAGDNTLLYDLARQYTLADNFFMGAFGGSFLNHQYLVCACAPAYPNADAPTGAQAGAAPTIAHLLAAAAPYTPELKRTGASPASALTGTPVFELSGNIAPADYFAGMTSQGAGFFAINTMQPAYQPSGNAPTDATAGNLPFAKPNANTTLPPQTAETIGSRLTAAGKDWAWYAGAWNAATADGQQDPATARKVIYKGNSFGVADFTNLDFQTHHHPFNYYAAYDPVAHTADRSQHMKDYASLLDQAKNGTLPPVAFYKPVGVNNQHPGYANVDDGDQHIAELVSRLQDSPQYKNMVIVITYDENGGFWDHVAPPKGDLLGPSTRIPAIIVSPFAKKGYVDHTQYDTASVQRLINRVFDLTPLPGITARDTALTAVPGGKAMGDLTTALKF